jgi:hypothetical protein
MASSEFAMADVEERVENKETTKDGDVPHISAASDNAFVSALGSTVNLNEFSTEINTHIESSMGAMNTIANAVKKIDINKLATGAADNTENWLKNYSEVAENTEVLEDLGGIMFDSVFRVAQNNCVPLSGVGVEGVGGRMKNKWNTKDDEEAPISTDDTFPETTANLKDFAAETNTMSVTVGSTAMVAMDTIVNVVKNIDINKLVKQASENSPVFENIGGLMLPVPKPFKPQLLDLLSRYPVTF